MSDAIRLYFAGAYRDSISAGYPLGDGYRWYLPGLMRFNAPDEESPFGPGGLNPYSYCGDDPVNHRDPTGHVSFGVLRRLFRSDTLDVGASARDTAADVPVAARRAVGASVDAAGAQQPDEPAPGYREQANSFEPAPRYGEPANSLEPPPAYRELDPYPPPPSFRETVAIPIYHEIRRDLVSLNADISSEWLRRYGSTRPADAKLPSVRDLTLAFFADTQALRRLRSRRAAELMRRQQNSNEYRVRLSYLKRRIREERAFDAEASLKRVLEETLQETKRLYRTLKS